MSDLFFRIIRHLLPSGRAWRLKRDDIRNFFLGLSGFPANIKTYLDNVWSNFRPQLTTSLELWEEQFALPDTGLTIQQRRDRLAAAWKAKGGQSPRYIQDTLQAAGFNVFVHEWWEPSIAHPTGGSVNGDVVPVVRNPFIYLWDGVSPRQYIGCGHNDLYCGGDLAFANPQNQPSGYPLVNKIYERIESDVGCGHNELYCGGFLAECGAVTSAFGYKQYIIPADSSKYPYFLYIGGETFPDLATIPLNRKEEFEDLCLKICPLEQWLGILAKYT